MTKFDFEIIVLLKKCHTSALGQFALVLELELECSKVPHTQREFWLCALAELCTALRSTAFLNAWAN
jgi:hypothetical protein